MLRRLVPLVVFMMAVAVVWADKPPAKPLPGEFMPLSEIKPGMAGIGKTVYKGTAVSTFAVEIVGILPQYEYGSSLIVARVSGGPMTERHANVAGGMSGSPIYINGKLVGAVSRLLGMFGVEPMCGVTPIESMFDSFDPSLPQKPGDFVAAPAPFRESVVVNGKTYTRLATGSAPAPRDLPTGTLYLRSTAPALYVSGLGPKAAARLQKAFPDVAVMQTGSSTGSSWENMPTILPADVSAMQPGSTMGISFAIGDVEVGALGTLTYRNGDNILAFGHPAMGIGPINGVLMSGHVLDYFPSLQRSEKLIVPDRPVGMSIQDRPWSIGGQLGKLPDLTPVRIRVLDKVTGKETKINSWVIWHPMLTSQFVATVFTEAMDRARPTPQETAAKVKFHVTAEESINVTRENTYFSLTGASDATSEVASIVETLCSNRFHPVRPTAIELDVELSAERKEVEIIHITADRSTVEPGDKVTVTVALKPHRKDPFTKTMVITVPKDAPAGKADLTIGNQGGGGGDGPVDIMMLLGGGASGLDDTSANSVGELVNTLNRRPRNTDLVATLQLKSLSPKARGETLVGLPRPLANAMLSRRTTELEFEREKVEVREPTDYVVVGAARLPLMVRPPANGPAVGPPEAGGPPMDGGPGSDVSMDEYDGSMEYYSTPELTAPAMGGVSPVVRLLQAAPDEVSGDEAVIEEDTGDQTPPESGDVEPPEPAGQAGPAAQPVSKVARVWEEKTAAAFAKGDVKGLGACSKDDLRLVPTLTATAQIDEPYIFSVVADANGDTYLGTGNKGKIYKVSAGKAELLYSTPEVAVLSLAMDRDGNLIAGTAPSGKVYRVGKDGRGSVLYATAEPSVTAVCVASDGRIYAGVSTPAKVYEIGADGNGRVVFAPAAMSVTTLAPGANGSVLVGLGKPGVVYRLAGVTATPVYDTGVDYVTSIAEANGAVYVSGDPRPSVVKVKPGAQAETLGKTKATVRAMAVDSQGCVYVAAGDTITRVDPSDAATLIDTPKEIDLSSLSIASNGRLVAGTFAPARTIEGQVTGSLAGTFESKAYDAGVGARWGRISWLADGATTVCTRTGNVAKPDDTWGPWSAPYASGDAITSLPGRYMQYRVALSGDMQAVPALKQIQISYLPPNQAPVVKLKTPKPGEAVSGEYKITWSGSDPDKDKLEYTLYSSADAGKTWTKMPAEVAPGNGDGKKPEDKKAPADANKKEPPKDNSKAPQAPPTKMTSAQIDEFMAQVEKELRDAGFPESEVQAQMDEARQYMEQNMPGEGAADGAKPEDNSAPKPDANTNGKLNGASFTWKTKDLTDGEYRIKIVVSDRIANGIDPKEAETIVMPVFVVNSKPAVALPESGITVGADGVVTATGSALQKMVTIKAVEFRVDETPWRAAKPEDGIFDSDAENFILVTDALEPGKHKIEVRAFNTAGLSDTATREVEIPKK